ncbi:unnamed protein product [Symbiodinium sp. CCMP2456]|nr:unnamed protein product [Symbiodinium sp. CCMP2456]
MAKVDMNGRSWRVIAGYCKIDDEGCITNGNYPNADTTACGIFVDESNKRRLFWDARPLSSPLLINGEERYGDLSSFTGLQPEGFILRREGAVADSFKVCLEDPEAWLPEQGWFQVLATGGIVGSCFCLCSCCLSRYLWKSWRQAARRKKDAELYPKWYPYYRHAMYSIIQSAFDEGAEGVKMLTLNQPTKPGRAYLFQAATEIQEDLSKAFESKKHPFYVAGKRVLNFTDINFEMGNELKHLSKEIKELSADRWAVIIAACDVKDVGEVKRVVRAHNTAKELQESHGRAKFAFMPLFEAPPTRESEGIKQYEWYSFYRFSVMAKMQIAVDEGATRLKLLGIQPGVGNTMTLGEYPALYQDLNEALKNREYPFIDVDGKKLLLEAEGFTMKRVRLQDFRPESFLDEHTEDLCSVIIVSATDADGREAAEVLKAFQNRHKGARQVMRAWATAEDQYGDPHGDHGSQGHPPLRGRTGKATTSTQDFTNVLCSLPTEEEEHPEGRTCQLESLDHGLAARARKREDATSCCWPANSEGEVCKPRGLREAVKASHASRDEDDSHFAEILEPDLQDRSRGEAVYCGNLLCSPP